MNKRECYCQSDSERVTCALRHHLTDGRHECPTLAPWERELLGMVEPEPYVDLYVTLKDGTVLTFPYVRGIGVEYIKHAPPSAEYERTLTMEGPEGIINVFDVAYWRSESCDQ